MSTTPAGAAPPTTDDRRPGTFTREELDAAEPEAPPSFRRRWLIGFVLGSVGGVVVGWGLPVNPVGLLALPWVFTPAGAGALVGAGSFLASLLLVTGGGVLGTEMDAVTAALVAATSAFLPIGLVGTAVASAPLGPPVTIAGDAARVVVRPAGVADAENLARVRIASWRGAYRGIVPDAVLDGHELAAEAARWRERLSTPGPAWVRVAFWAATPALAGFVTAGPGRHDGEAGLGEIWAMYVDPAAQGRGVGRALMAAAVRGLAVRGFGEAVLWVFEANVAARAFYERVGWTPDGAAKAFPIGDAAPIEVRYRTRLG